MIVFVLLLCFLSLLAVVVSAGNFLLLMSAVTLLVRLNDRFNTVEGVILPATRNKPLRGPYMTPDSGLVDVATPLVPYDAMVSQKSIEDRWGTSQ